MSGGKYNNHELNVCRLLYPEHEIGATHARLGQSCKICAGMYVSLRQQGYRPGVRANRACPSGRSRRVSCQAMDGLALQDDRVTDLGGCRRSYQERDP